jgi:shikimate kinase
MRRRPSAVTRPHRMRRDSAGWGRRLAAEFSVVRSGVARQYAQRVLVYITGVPGSGKSTVCAELQACGYASVDADDAIGAWVSRETGETLERPPAFAARTPEFYDQHDWCYQADKAEQLAASYAAMACFMGGCGDGENEISHLFAKAFFLHVGADELRHRLLTRTNGPFANASRAVRAAQVERVLPRRAALERTWLRNGFEMVSSMQPLTDVVADILLRCGLPLRASKHHTAMRHPGTS